MGSSSQELLKLFYISFRQIIRFNNFVSLRREWQMLMLRDNHFREVQLYFSKIRASKLLESLPSDESRWVESGYAHWINRLVPASEHLPEPQRSWYLRGYRSRYLRSAQ